MECLSSGEFYELTHSIIFSENNYQIIMFVPEWMQRHGKLLIEFIRFVKSQQARIISLVLVILTFNERQVVIQSVRIHVLAMHICTCIADCAIALENLLIRFRAKTFSFINFLWHDFMADAVRNDSDFKLANDETADWMT